MASRILLCLINLKLLALLYVIPLLSTLFLSISTLARQGLFSTCVAEARETNVFSLDADNRRCITLVTQSVGNVPCFVYSDYKHVGSIHPDSCSYSQEAAARILSSRVAKRETCTMTNSKLLDIKTKIHLVKTFCISRLFFNVASIPHWTSKSLTNFCKCYNSIFRSALLGRNDEGEVEKISNLALFSQWPCSSQVLPSQIPF